MFETKCEKAVRLVDTEEENPRLFGELSMRVAQFLSVFEEHMHGELNETCIGEVQQVVQENIVMASFGQKYQQVNRKFFIVFVYNYLSV